jgi:hypothetical protein
MVARRTGESAMAFLCAFRVGDRDGAISDLHEPATGKCSVGGPFDRDELFDAS